MWMAGDEIHVLPSIMYLHNTHKHMNHATLDNECNRFLVTLPILRMQLSACMLS